MPIENLKIIGFLLVLSGAGIIYFVFTITYPSQVNLLRQVLFLLYDRISKLTIVPPNLDQYRSELLLLLTIVFQLAQQIESGSINIYIGVALIIIGGIIMLIGDFSFELIEEEEGKSLKIINKK